MPSSTRNSPHAKSSLLSLLKSGIRLDFHHAYIDRRVKEGLLWIAVGIQQHIDLEQYPMSNDGLTQALEHVASLKGAPLPAEASGLLSVEREALIRAIEQQTQTHPISSSELIAIVQLAAAASSVGITALELIHTGIQEQMLRAHPDLAATYRSVMREPRVRNGEN